MILIVTLFGIYILANRYYQYRIQEKQLSLQSPDNSSSIQIKLQAYERLVLLLERIDIPQLVLRLKESKMNNSDLFAAMMISIHKEFEHNSVQQLYVSDQLWEIVHAAKDNVVTMINSIYESSIEEGKDFNLADDLMKNYSLLDQKTVPTAISAVKKETQLLF